MSRWAISQTYEDVESLIFERCWHFKGIYGGVFEDWLSEANWIFMEAYRDFDSDRGTGFSYYLRYLLDRRLVDVLRNNTRRLERTQTNKEIESAYKGPDTMERIIAEVSEDAQTIIGLILEIPMDIKLAMFEKRKQQTDASKFKECLREFLSDLGWSVPQINSTLQEIKESL